MEHERMTEQGANQILVKSQSSRWANNFPQGRNPFSIGSVQTIDGRFEEDAAAQSGRPPMVILEQSAQSLAADDYPAFHPPFAALAV
jgi:hypothetical protein